MAWWKNATRFQRISLALLVLAIAVDGYRMATGAGAAFGFILFALTLVFFAHRRKILWRVRNRLLLMFFLLGVMPLLLILTMLDFTTILVLGQVAADRVRQDLDARIESIKAVAEDLKTEASHNASPESLKEIALREPHLEAIVEAGGKS